jgi:hypothetical protein
VTEITDSKCDRGLIASALGRNIDVLDKRKRASKKKRLISLFVLTPRKVVAGFIT